MAAELQAPEVRASYRLRIEDFAEVAARSLDEVTVAVLRPWSSGQPPPGIFAPRGTDGAMSPEDIAAMQGPLLLTPCTFDDPQETEVVSKMLPQFSGNERLCVFMALILPEGLELTEEINDAVMARNSALLELGVDEVIIDPPSEAMELRRVVNLSRSVWDLNVRRMQLMLETEQHISQEELARTEAWHSQLLWRSIPRALMLHFPPLNPDLVELRDRVENYRLVRRFETVHGNVLLALDAQLRPCAIKVIDKNKVVTPGELESIYREYHFLSEAIRHPNVAHCLEMLHSSSRVYLVFEFAGNANLAQVLCSRPGQRLPEPQALSCFQQVNSGLAHCHSKDVAHRRVTLAHVAVSHTPDVDSFKCVIVDFYNAMVARGGSGSTGESTSVTVCGGLPFIAPEMALRQPYVPRRADCWSLGMVLLEMAGGLGSLARALGYDEANRESQAVLDAAAQQALVYFASAENCAVALGLMGAVSSRPITTRLEMLLRPVPGERSPLSKLVLLGPNDVMEGRNA